MKVGSHWPGGIIERVTIALSPPSLVGLESLLLQPYGELRIIRKGVIEMLFWVIDGLVGVSGLFLFIAGIVMALSS